MPVNDCRLMVMKVFKWLKTSVLQKIAGQWLQMTRWKWLKVA